MFERFEKMTDSQLLSLRNRKNTFQKAVVFVVVVFAMGAAVGFFGGKHANAQGIQLVHSGGVAKDGCHKNNKKKERHWHFKGTSKRGGACIESGGKTIKYQGDWQCANVKTGRVCFRPTKR